MNGKRILVSYDEESETTVLQVEGEPQKYKIEKYSDFTVSDSIAHNFGLTHFSSQCIFCEVNSLRNKASRLKSLVEG